MSLPGVTSRAISSTARAVCVHAVMRFLSPRLARLALAVWRAAGCQFPTARRDTVTRRDSATPLSAVTVIGTRTERTQLLGSIHNVDHGYTLRASQHQRQSAARSITQSQSITRRPLLPRMCSRGRPPLDSYSARWPSKSPPWNSNVDLAGSK